MSKKQLRYRYYIALFSMAQGWCSGMTWSQVAQSAPLRKTAHSPQQSESPEQGVSFLRTSSTSSQKMPAAIKKIPSGPLPTVRSASTSSSEACKTGVLISAATQQLKRILWKAAIQGNCPVLLQEVTKDATVVHLCTNENKMRPLHWAAEKGHLAAVELLLAHGAQVNAIDTKGRSALHLACFGGYFEVVKKLCEGGASVLHHDNDGKTVLHWAKDNADIVGYLIKREPRLVKLADRQGIDALQWAASGGHLNVVRILLGHGSPVDRTDLKGRTALWRAAGEGRLAVCEVLVQAGANINAKDSQKQPVIAWAAHNNREDVVRYLVERKVNLMAQDAAHKTPLHWAVQHPDLVRLFLKAGAKPNALDDKRTSPLTWASYYGALGSVEVLLAYGADPNLRDQDDKSALALAAEAGHVSVVKALMATKKICKEDYVKSLCWAASGGKLPVLEALLGEGVDVNCTTSGGKTPLAWAAMNHHVDIVRFLLLQGAKADKPDLKGDTPLSWAVQKDQAAIVELLLKHNANPRGRDERGKTPLHWAKSSDVANLLIKAGALVDEGDKEGKTALHWACHEGRKDLVSCLLSQGANVDLCDDEGCSPLYWAAGHPELVKLLLDKKANLTLQDENGLDALHSAIAHGDLNCVRAFVDAGMDPEYPCKQHITPLMRAVQANQEGIVTYLLAEKKVPVNSVTPQGESALVFAVTNHHEKIYALLLTFGADPMVVDEYGRTLLHEGAIVGNYPFIQEALQKSIFPIDACCQSKGRSALQWALRMCKGACKKAGEHNPISVTAAVIFELVIHGASVDLKDRSGCSALEHLENQPWKCSRRELELLVKATTYQNLTPDAKRSFFSLFSDIYQLECFLAEENNDMRAKMLLHAIQNCSVLCGTEYKERNA